jgi:starch synthase
MPLYVKQLYKRDPHFADAKVVTSVYADTFEGKLDSKIAQKISFDGIGMDQMEQLKNPTYENLTKLALQHSDGAILAEPGTTPSIETYCNSIDLPVLKSYNELDQLSATDEFYDSIVLGKTELVD